MFMYSLQRRDAERVGPAEEDAQWLMSFSGV